MCEQRLKEGEIPQCVAQCGGNARFVGDLEKGWDSFIGSMNSGERGEGTYGNGGYRKMTEFLEEFTDDQVYALPDVGNGPACRYILRRHHWEGGDC